MKLYGKLLMEHRQMIMKYDTNQNILQKIIEFIQIDYIILQSHEKYLLRH
jgi:hypothetical protein